MQEPTVHSLGLQEYTGVWKAMREFTARRARRTPDELWLLQHLPVFTLGQAGDPSHILEPAQIPVVHSDRGGQVTYHGPGQLVVYVLVDIVRAGLGVRRLIRGMEQSVINLLAGERIEGERRVDAPGVYVGGRKICALGIRVKKGCCYHGLSLNVDMDLIPFSRINPCGYAGLEVTQLVDLGVDRPIDEVGGRLVEELKSILR